ncbi:MAG: branched-chain amino acid ABC transporter permease [Gaiellaceae bacterium]
MTPIAVSFSEYIVQIIAGLGAGAVLFLIASGLTLVFGALRVINFAHGSLVMLGAYIVSSLTPLGGLENWNFWLVFIAAALIVAAGGLIMEVIFFRPIYRRPLLTQLLVTFALVLIVAGVVREFWGPTAFTTSIPPALDGSVGILGGGRIPTFNFVFIGLAVVVAVALWAILYKTGLGRMIRAAVSDPELLRLSGVNVRILFTGVFVLAAFFAGLAGAFSTLQGAVNPQIAVTQIILAFVVVVIGGLGSLSGAFIASFLVGVAEALGILWVPQASLAIVFAVLVVVLALRPEGLMGQKSL